MSDKAMVTAQPLNLMAAGEVAASAVATQAMAMVQSKYVMARANPRNLEQVRVALLKECKRPGFAAVAKYHLPFGDGVEGPSIRFAEAALRCMTNMWSNAMVVWDDDEKRILSVTVTDLETNVAYDETITITKTVERKHLKSGQKALSTRTNSYGKTLYTVEATEGEIRAKQAAEMSKVVRTLGLRHLPGDIMESALAQVDKTVKEDTTKHPDEARRALVDAFASIGIQPQDLVTYLRHPIEQMHPGEVQKLRGIFAALKDGQVTWNDVIIGTFVPDEGPSKTNRTAEELKKRRQETAKQPEPPKEEKPAPEDPGYGPPPWDEDPPASDKDDVGF